MKFFIPLFLLSSFIIIFTSDRVTRAQYIDSDSSEFAEICKDTIFDEYQLLRSTLNSEKGTVEERFIANLGYYGDLDFGIIDFKPNCLKPSNYVKKNKLPRTQSLEIEQ
ncbi:MAG: hypothetical protein LAT67_15005 [Balneolales bacterium]|nr:hypothetical protein [Balneolales bacterium]